MKWMVGLLAIMAIALLLMLVSRAWRRSPRAAGTTEGSTETGRDRRPNVADETGSDGEVAKNSDEAPQLIALRNEAVRLRAALEVERQKRDMRCLMSLAPDCPFLNVSNEMLAQMARCAIVRMDMPTLDSPLTDSKEGELGEVEVVRRRFAADLIGKLRSIYVELRSGADPPQTMTGLLDAIEAEIPAPQTDAALRQIARQRAGLDTSTDTQAESVGERFWRLRAGIGDAFEERLAEALGSGRARQLREESNGWPRKAIFSGKCDSDGGAQLAATPR
jgi:hypothetical protein